MEFLIPKAIKSVHAFHTEKDKVVKINMRGALLSQGFYGSMKEKLMKKQDGLIKKQI
jgi:hypothetical protein